MNSKKILANFQLIYTIDIKPAGENEIDGLPYLSRIAVFDRQHGEIAFPLYHRVICRGEIAIRNPIGFGENPSSGNMGKRALHAAVNHPHSLRQTPP